MATDILRTNSIQFSTVYESNGGFLYTPDLDVGVLAHPDVLISALRDLKLQSKAADQWFTTNVVEKVFNSCLLIFISGFVLVTLLPCNTA